MKPRRAHRGQPLLVLAMVLGAWIGFRVVLWQDPFADAAQGGVVAAQASARAPVFATFRQLPAEPRAAAAPNRSPAAARTRAASAPVESASSSGAVRSTPLEPVVAPPLEPVPARLEPAPPPIEPMPPRTAAGHNLMLMAGFSNLELPPEIARYFAPQAAAAPAAVPFRPTMAMVSSGTDRWSADAWLLLRKDSTTAVTSGRGSYGQSQFGAVLRYRLWPSSGHRPTAYLRVSQALAGAKESEAALGLAARPVPGLPLVAAAELRLTRANGRTQARPAVYAVTELPTAELPGGFTGEAYLQAGYVGGDFDTAFVDGQVRAERRLFDLGSAELRAGGGAWGGAQDGASRLDIGPSATLKVQLGQTPSRVSMDWRFRIAGEAEPKSGPALTISAGF